MKAVLLAMALIGPMADQARWPAFLGAGQTGIETDALPLTWSPSENIAWQLDLPGHGQSSPVVWDDGAYVTSVEGENKDTYRVIRVNVASGEIDWQQEIANSVPVENTLYVSRAAPTPVVDQRGVYALMESGDVGGWDHQGKQLWKRNLAADYGPFVAEFGLGASPCQTADHLFVLLEHEGPSNLVALDKQTGETVWAVEREPRASWSSPAIIDVGGSPQVVVSSGGTVDGYDPATGERLWRFDDVGGNTATTPVDAGEGRFLVAASPGRSGEYADVAGRSNALFRVSPNDEGGFAVERVWTAEKATPSWASPILHRGFAYWINRTGVIYCFDGETGENVYTERTRQSCWATPYPAGDRIYFFGKDGLTTVIATGAEFKVLAENTLFTADDFESDPLAAEETDPQRRQAAAMFSGPTVYGYAVAGDRLLIRIGQRMYAVAN